MLGDKSKYTKTNKVYKGESIYKDSKGRSYYVDNGHTGEASHIEVFSKNGKHLGTIRPNGQAVPNSIDPSKTLPKSYR